MIKRTSNTNDLKPGPAIPALGIGRQEGQEFKTTLFHRVIMKPVCAVCDTSPKYKTKEIKHMKDAFDGFIHKLCIGQGGN